MLFATHKAFTMIEMIFVIVIIGILSVVVIPRMSIDREDAQAAICANEVGNFVSEISSNYVKVGYSTFQNLTLTQLTNITLGVVDGDRESGISSTSTDTIADAPYVYLCEGKEAVSIGFTEFVGRDYNLTITPKDGAENPAAAGAATIIAKNFKTSLGTRVDFALTY